MQKTAIAYLIHNIPHNTEIREIECGFRLIDEDNDGRITRDNLVNIFNLFEVNDLNRVALKVEVDLIFDCVDSDHNGYIENEEFIRACIDREKLFTEKHLKFTFEFFDPHSLGYISLRELNDRFDKGIMMC